MRLRKTIIDKLDRFYSMAGSNPPEEMKALNLENWHIALVDVSDKAIDIGFKRALNSDIKRIPFPGEFKKLCTTRQISNMQIEDEEKPYIPVSPEIGKANAKKILNKLLAMNKS